MLIEVSESMKVRLPDRELYLTPGTLVELEDRYAVKLIERLGGVAKVGVLLSNSSRFHAGQMISWQSPLFGRCHGCIAIVHADYEWILVANHSVTKDFAFVSKEWDVRVIDEPGRESIACTVE